LAKDSPSKREPRRIPWKLTFFRKTAIPKVEFFEMSSFPISSNLFLQGPDTGPKPEVSHLTKNREPSLHLYPPFFPGLTAQNCSPLNSKFSPHLIPVIWTSERSKWIRTPCTKSVSGAGI
jgi:hypothetical protein